MVCTFFGHRTAGEEIAERLREIIIDLIENKNVTLFYVGNQGHFDAMVRRELKKLKGSYPHIRYFVVLAYIPSKQKDEASADYSDTIYFTIPKNTPPRFAIDKRNRIMIEKADFVVTYVRTVVGGAAKFKEIAEKQRKTVINI